MPTKKAATGTGRGTSIMRCTCTNAFQDAQYGRGMRAHNGTNRGARCTVCARESAR